MSSFTLIAALLVLAACGASAQNISANLALGAYKGTCVQMAAVYMDPKSGPAAYCLPNTSIATQPYYVKWGVANGSANGTTSYTYQGVGDAVNITSYFNASSSIYLPTYYSGMAMVSQNNISITEDGVAYCLPVTVNGTSYAFRAYTYEDGNQLVYVEEGVFMTGTNGPMVGNTTCPSMDNPALYCDDNSFNYRCIAYSVDSVVLPM